MSTTPDIDADSQFSWQAIAARAEILGLSDLVKHYAPPANAGWREYDAARDALFKALWERREAR